jgi:hypothetical protein
MGAAALRRTTAILGPAVVIAAESVARGTASAGTRSRVAAELAVVDGGTDVGVMAAIGRTRAESGSVLPVLLGVAPGGKVTWPHGPADGQAALEPNHSHFILAEATDWGGETGLLIEVAARLADGQVVIVVAGGGKTACAEVLAAVRQGWKVFVIAGTGGVAQQIARARHQRGGRKRGHSGLGVGQGLALAADEAAALDEIVREGDIEVFAGDDPRQLGYRLAWELRDEAVLKGAWRTCATYDRIAVQEHAAFQRFQATIIALGLAATLLALIEEGIGRPESLNAMHWPHGGHGALRSLVVIVPILVSVLIARSARRSDGDRWITLRAAAEEAKTEIYRYRTRTGAYRDEQRQRRQWATLAGRRRAPPSVHRDRAQAAGGQGGSPSSRRQTRVLQARLSRVNDHVVKTHAAMGPLTPYAGPLPPPVAGSVDDGLSPLDAQGYLRIRVHDQIGYFHRRICYLDRLRARLELVAIAAGGAGAVAAALGVGTWIGLTSGITGAALTYRGYLQVENNIVAYNQAASRLADLDRWWHALSPGQRTTKALGYLVSTAETVLARERAGWVAQTSETVKYLQAQGGGDVQLVPRKADNVGVGGWQWVLIQAGQSSS